MIIDWSAEELAAAIHQSLIYFQYRNRFLSNAYSQPISPVESHIIIEIAAATRVFASTLIDLGLGNQAMIARRIRDLVDAKLVIASEDSEDARLRPLRLTPKGESILHKLDEQSNQLKRSFARGFRDEELEQLAELVDELCGHGGVPASCRRREDTALRSALRRMARLMGVLTPNFMGSGRSSIEWHVLQAVRYSDPAMTARDVVSLLNVEQSHVSRIIYRLRHDGLIRERNNPHDRRSKYLELTSRGVSLLQSSDAEAIKRLVPPLSCMKSADRYRLAWLVAHYAFGKGCDEFDGISCVESFSNKDLLELRRWLVRWLGSQHMREMPTQLLHPSSRILAAYDTSFKQNPCAILEVHEVGPETAEVITFAIDSGICRHYLRRLEVSMLLIRALGKRVRRLIVREDTVWPLAFMEPRIFGLEVLRPL